MEAVFILFAVLCFGIIVGWELRERSAKRFVDKFVEENLDQLQQHVEEHSINIVIEKHGDMFYVFQKEDSSFMAQGKDIKQLESALAKSYPGKRFFASSENLKEVGIKA